MGGGQDGALSLGPPAVPFLSPFLVGEGSPYSSRRQKKQSWYQLIPTSLLDLFCGRVPRTKVEDGTNGTD